MSKWINQDANNISKKRCWRNYINPSILVHDSMHVYAMQSALCYRPFICLSVRPSVAWVGGSVKNG